MEATAPRDIVDRAAPEANPEHVRQSELFVPCDAKECGAKSWYFVQVFGGELSYCGHHANMYEVALLPKATKVVDLRYLILP